MLYSTLMLMMSSAFLMLRLTPGGSFPRPLSEAEERKYLDAWLQGDLEARNVLIERNLRLVAHRAHPFGSWLIQNKNTPRTMTTRTT